MNEPAGTLSDMGSPSVAGGNVGAFGFYSCNPAATTNPPRGARAVPITAHPDRPAWRGLYLITATNTEPPRLLPSAVQTRKWTIWRATTQFGEPLCKRRSYFYTAGDVDTIALSADGKRLVLADPKKGIVLRDAASGNRLWTVECPKGWSASAFCFSPDGKTLAAALRNDEADRARILLIDMRSGCVRYQVRGHNAPILALAFSPDGRLLASGGRDTTILLWDLRRSFRF